MKEYGMDVTVNYEYSEKDIDTSDWYPDIGSCLSALKLLIEKEAKATSFAIAIVQRDHTP